MSSSVAGSWILLKYHVIVYHMSNSAKLSNFKHRHSGVSSLAPVALALPSAAHVQTIDQGVLKNR